MSKPKRHKEKFDADCTKFIEDARLREDSVVFKLFHKVACSQDKPTVVSLNAALREIKKTRPNKLLLCTIAGGSKPCTS